MVKKSQRARLKTPWTIVIPESLMDRLHKHLFPGDNDEHGAIIAAGVTQTSRGNRLLARDLFLAEDRKDYVRGDYGYRMLKAEFIRDKILYCREEHLAYLAVHCHGGSESVGFSIIDLESHERGYPALRDIIRGKPVGGLVFAQNAIAGDIWLPNGEREELDSAVIVGAGIRRLYPEPPETVRGGDSSYDRQTRIFGDRGQYLLSRLKVGVIGAGGAGSLAIEYVARLGVNYLVVADPECLDETNKPRVVGSTDSDVANHVKKIDIAKRVARAANSKIRIDTIYGNIVDESVARNFVDCDYLFLAADSMQARLIFNALVHQFLIPGIQFGTKVSTDPNTGEVRDIFCMSRPVTPDCGCLWCNGLISSSQLQEEAISEEERKTQRYIDDPQVKAPSVITLNAIATAHATNWFLFSATSLFHHDMSQDFLRWRPQINEMCFDIPRKDPQCVECGLTQPSRFARGDSWTLPTKPRR